MDGAGRAELRNHSAANAEKINDNITSWRKDRKITKMGTTMSALKFGQEAIYGLSIGDSRIYRMHDGKLEQLSTDHTFRRPGHMKSALTEYLGKEHQAEFPRTVFSVCLMKRATGI